MMLDQPGEAIANGEGFPHVEQVLQCGLYLHDVKSGKATWSPGVFQLLAVAPNSLPCRFETFLEFVVPEDRKTLKAEVEKALSVKANYKLEFGIVDGKGNYKRIYAEIAFENKEGGSGDTYMGVLKDISENYFFKKALEQKILQLDKTNQNLQEFVYIASHDLQEPLRKVSTFIGRLSSRFQQVLGEEGNMYVQRVLSASTNMQTLLEDLLNFSRLSFTAKEPENVKLEEVLKSVLNDLEVKIEETQAQISCDPLPDIKGFHSQLKQLFANLIGNSIKFRQVHERPAIRISCSTVSAADLDQLPLEKGREYLKLVFTDNGIGFEQEFAEKIFQVFQRLNGKSEYAGSGIGLAICKRITENHQGFIFANSSPGQGAEFTVVLPSKNN